MPAPEISKLYYSISEVGTLLGLEPHVLRYWETEFDQLKPRKNRAGRRIYTQADIATAQRIKALLREEKYTLDGARQVLARDEVPPSLREDLRELRALLVQLNEQL